MNVRDVNVHRLIVFLTSLLVDETRTETLDLDSCPCLLLDVFHEHALDLNVRHIRIKALNNDIPMAQLLWHGR